MAGLSNTSQAAAEHDLFVDINWPEDQEPETTLADDQVNVEDLDRLSNVGFCACEKECSCKGVSPPQSSFRFSKEAKSILRVWFNEHRDNPYPTSEQKDELAERTQLKRSQISLWLANTRRRYRSRIPDTTQQKRRDPHAMPPPDQPKETLNPFERWKILPLEEEATAAPLILHYVESTTPSATDNVPAMAPTPYAASTFGAEQSTTTQNDYFWAQSMASYETGPTSILNGSSISDTTAFSYSQSTGARSNRRRRRIHMKAPPKPTSSRKDRPFQCTFCPNATFATKYDWQRHEKSQHLSLEKWTCCATGSTIGTKDGPACAFCGCLFPDMLHMETHHYLVCHERDITQRTFYRKDHFQQHLRLIHDSKYHPRMDLWKDEMTDIKSRCGFCNARFSTWSARTDHLASHFKCHADMKNWTYGLGLELHIAALVERSTRIATSEPSLEPVSARPELPLPPPPRFSSGVNNGCSYPGFAPGQDLLQVPHNPSGGLGWSAHYWPGLSIEPSGFDCVDASDVLDWAV